MTYFKKRKRTKVHSFRVRIPSPWSQIILTRCAEFDVLPTTLCRRLLEIEIQIGYDAFLLNKLLERSCVLELLMKFVSKHITPELHERAQSMVEARFQALIKTKLASPSHISHNIVVDDKKTFSQLKKAGSVLRVQITPSAHVDDLLYQRSYYENKSKNLIAREMIVSALMTHTTRSLNEVCLEQMLVIDELLRAFIPEVKRNFIPIIEQNARARALQLILEDNQNGR